MKYLFFLTFFPCLLLAQERSLSANVQLHRDFHREMFTSTVELFEIDRYGTSFFFTDFDYGSAGQQASYFEVLRNHRIIRMGKANWNASLQYNDGVLPTDADMGKGIPRTLLYGAALSDIMWGPAYFEFQALIRQEFGADLGWQLTAVWDWPIPKTPIEFLGYVDWNSNETNHQPTSLQTEPQVQIRYGSFAVGTEVEISRNFTGAFTENNGFAYRTWYAHPTLFIKAHF